MNLYLDTANDDFVVAIFGERLTLAKSYVLKNYPKKVELIPTYVEKILTESKINISEINSFWINIGPGYFTGVRIALIYLRTIALALKKNIKTISTMQILQTQNPEQNEFIINARGNKYYSFLRNKKEFSKDQIMLKTGEFEKYDSVNYEEFLLNFAKYKNSFKDYEDIMDIEPLYIKGPQIGVKK